LSFFFLPSFFTSSTTALAPSVGEAPSVGDVPAVVVPAAGAGAASAGGFSFFFLPSFFTSSTTAAVAVDTAAAAAFLGAIYVRKGVLRFLKNLEKSFL
jgi:hypothetical protein